LGVIMGTKLREGQKAPSFEGSTADGSKLSLKELIGKKNVVLYFYPKDDTPGCTKEACNFRDNIKLLGDLGAEIVGVSLDSVESHKKFREKYNLPFPLLSDKNKRIATAYGVLKEGGTSASRVTFVIDRKGKIARIFPKVDVNIHAEEVAAVLKELS